MNVNADASPHANVMTESERQLHSVIRRAESFSDQNFRLLLEEVLKRGGKEAESAYSQLLADVELPLRTRMNLVRVCGYKQNHGFLVRLKSIIEKEINVHLRKEAIIAVAKYNDKRALSILNSALTHVQGGMLQSMLAGEIRRVKQNNPLLAMMSRFLEGSGNPKAFAVTVQVLKRILVPADALTFVPFLDSEDPVIRTAAYEILCACADGEVQEPLLAYFRLQVRSLDCLAAADCDSLCHLLLQLEKFTQRQPVLAESWLADLRNIFDRSTDQRIHELVLAVMGTSGSGPALDFIAALYDESDVMRPACRDAMARHDAGLERLIVRFRRQQSDRLELLTALLGNDTGCRFLADSLADTDVEVRDFLLRHLTRDNYRHFALFVRQILLSREPALQKAALNQIRLNQDFLSASVLLMDNAEETFNHCSESYFETLAHLFPARAFFRLFAKLGQMQLPGKILLRYFHWLDPWLEAEPVVEVNAPDTFRLAFATLTKLGNQEINFVLLDVLRRLKTFDPKTLALWQDILNEFTAHLKEKAGSDEMGHVRKARANLRDIGDELGHAGEGLRLLDSWLRQPGFDGDALENLIKSQPLAVFQRRAVIREHIGAALDADDAAVRAVALHVLSRHPRLAGPLAERLQALQPQPDLRLHFDLDELKAAVLRQPRFRLLFHIPALMPDVMGQLGDLIPEIPVAIEGDIAAGDFLIADSPALKVLMVEGSPAASRIYVVLKDLADYNAIRSCQPLTLSMPLSLARLCRNLVHDLFN